MSGVVNPHREESPAPVSARPTVADLESGDLSLAQLDAFVPETRAEARALQAAKARLGAPVAAATVTDLTQARTRGPRGSHRAKGVKLAKAATSARPGSAFTRPRQAAALLALTGALSAVQATSAQGESRPTDTAAAGISTLLATQTDALLLEPASRSNARTGLASTTATPSASASAAEADAANAEVAAQATELESRRAEAQQAVLDQRAAEEAAAAAAAQAAADAAAAQAAADAAAQAAAEEAARWALVAPVDARIISGFGYRIHPVYGTSRMHTGLDYSARCGVVVGAAEDGTVVESGWMSGYGWRIVIDHGMVDGRNIRTTYNHLSKRNVNAGAKVAKGEQIGLVGTTGTSTGCHLHFEVQRDKTLVNPANYL